ncbi:unnamed protein product [Cochlearia groenlandica]
MEKKQSVTNTFWTRGSCIGRGCFGTVSKATVKNINGEIFAVKSVDLATCLPSQAESLENEISTLRSLKSHPHIVRYFGDDVSKEGTASFRNLHMEYLPQGDVSSLNGGIVDDENLLRRYVSCLVSALSHVHSNGIVHCDVKTRNVLVVDGRNSVKLADFGSAMEIDENPRDAIAPRGSPLWMAPEVIRREYQGPESDVWSLGCTVIEMITGKPAWEDEGFESLSRIGFSNESPDFPASVSDLGRDFLEKCLIRDFSQRWSCDQLLKHPFLCEDRISSFAESSPRCVLDWVNSEFEEEEEEEDSDVSSSMDSAMARIGKLATSVGAIWESNGWIEVRNDDSEELGANLEYLVLRRVESELNNLTEATDDFAGPSENKESVLTYVARCGLSPDIPVYMVHLVAVADIISEKINVFGFGKTEMITPTHMDIDFMCNGSVAMMGDMMYVRSARNSFVYKRKERKWETDEVLNSKKWCDACVVKDVLYYFDRVDDRLRAYDTKERCWGVVKGLDRFFRAIGNLGSPECVSCGGKITLSRGKGREFWCEEISLLRRRGGEIWGNVEWLDHAVAMIGNDLHLRTHLVVMNL